MKQKVLLLAVLMIAGAFGSKLYAQKDVTAQYITNATLSSLDGWTNVNFNTPVNALHRNVNNDNIFSNATTGYASECYAGWGGLEKENYSLTQTIKLPAGNYTLVNYSFFRYGQNVDSDASKSQAFLKAGDAEVPIKTLGSITASGYANSQWEAAGCFDAKMYRNTIDFSISTDDTEIEIGIEGTFDLMRSWCIVGQFELIANDIVATLDSPFDVTGYIINPGFEYRDMTGWTLSEDGAIGTQNNDQSFKTAWFYAEKWQSATNGALSARSMSQTISGQKAGYYRLTANLGGDGTYIDLNGTKASWTKDGDYTIDYVLAEDGDLTISAGKTAEGAANWIHFDNFKLYYCGEATVSVVAEEFTSGNEAQADTWYAIEIPLDGDYNITAGSSLADVIYTTNGNMVLSEANQQTTQFTETMTLAAGTYYFKSASAQTLTITPLSYTYTIGEPTLNIADGAYVNELTTWVLTFNPITDDPSAAFALIGEGKAQLKNGEEVVAEGALSLEGNTLTATFSNVTLNNGAAYTLLLPAGVVGFEGQAVNEAISITFQTPSIADGIYYLYDATEKLFLGRGGAWGTEAVADKYGVPFNWKTGADGAGSIEFIDWPDVYLYITGTGVFTDKPSTGWKLVEKEGGYNLCSADGTVYTTHELGGLGEYVHTTENASLATVWKLMNKADHDAIVAEYPTDNKTSVAGAANIDGELDAYIATLSAVDMTDKIGTAVFAREAGDWTFSEVKHQDNQPAYGDGFCEAWNATGSWTQTVEGLPKGIYKLTVNGFERRTNNATSYALGEQGYNLVSSNMTANGEQVRFASWFDAVEKNGDSYNPNDTRGAVAKFEAGKYLNELYVYVGDDGKLDITVNKPNYTWDCWTLFNNFTLTYYAEPIEVEISSVGYSTLYYGELNLTIPENVEVYTATVNDRKIEMNKADAAVIPAGTGVIIKAAAGTYQFAVSSDEPESTTAFDNNDLKGTDETTTISEEGYKYYVLSVKGGKKIGFYYAVDGGASVENGAHKAYLAVPVSEANAAGFEIETANGIEDMQLTRTANGEAYTISGVRMKSGNLPKGLYIIDGKKTVIK